MPDSKQQEIIKKTHQGEVLNLHTTRRARKEDKNNRKQKNRNK